VVPFSGYKEILMARILDAIYEDGVLKPLEDPGLTNHERVTLEIRERGPESTERPRQRTFGSARGLIKIADDFDAPLEDFREYM
jgi:predicted DNA-binding antitoxin AbrB/MazE fold protein